MQRKHFPVMFKSFIELEIINVPHYCIFQPKTFKSFTADLLLLTRTKKLMSIAMNSQAKTSAVLSVIWLYDGKIVQNMKRFNLTNFT